jgi:secondary thiamine-phosphate synthase enzyme
MTASSSKNESHQTKLELSTDGFSSVYDVTDDVESFVREVGGSGLVNVFIPGSTASVTTIEYEEGCINDLKNALEEIAPRDETYRHNEKWGDGNGFSHLRSSLMGPEVTVPFRNGKLQNGTWQQIVLVDNDNRGRDRTLLLTIV